MPCYLREIIRDTKDEIKVIPHESRVLDKLMKCRTPELGEYTLKCSDSNCSYTEVMYKSCNDRHCPNCQSLLQLEWIKKTIEELLPVCYSHIVFTPPSCLHKTFQYNDQKCLNILFKSVKYALCDSSEKMGAICVCHTSTQKLDYHPHIHCLIPEGKISSDKSKWIHNSNKSILSKEKLEIRFKKKLIKEVNKLYEKGDLIYPKTDNKLKYINDLNLTMKQALKAKFKVYSKRYISDVESIIQYLGQNIKKVAITNERIVDYHDGKVTFTWSDRADGNNIKEKTLDAASFLKRFVLHILPYRFTKVRYLGFLSNSCKKSSLKLCKILIKEAVLVLRKVNNKILNGITAFLRKIKIPKTCPCCKVGYLTIDGY